MRDQDYRRAVETAAKLGAKIEWKLEGDDYFSWAVANSPPTWNWSHYDYRVAPAEPGKPREWWISETESEFIDIAYRKDGSKRIHVREVLPDASELIESARQQIIDGQVARGTGCGTRLTRERKVRLVYLGNNIWHQVSGYSYPPSDTPVDMVEVLPDPPQ